MKKTLLTSAIAALTIAPNFTFADDTELKEIKQRLAQLEAEKAATTSNVSWIDQLAFAALIEMEASANEFVDDNGKIDSENDLVVSTVELGLEAVVNDYTTATIIGLYEEDGDGLDIDVVTITFGNEEKTPFSLVLGQDYLPFGSYETNLVNDTLGLEIGETLATTSIVGVDVNGFSASAYIYNNERDGQDNEVTATGFSAGYASDTFSIGADYINDILSSDSLRDLDLSAVDDTYAISLHATAQLGDFNLIGEYIVTDTIEEAGVKSDLTTAQLEAAYAFGDFTLAAAYQVTEDATELLPEERLSIGGNYDVLDNLNVGVEFWQDKDYNKNDGGTGESLNNVAVLVAVEF